MDKTEAYLYLFSDALFSGLVLNSKSELVIDVMRIFNSYNSILIILLSVIGSFVASLINILLGRVIRKVKKTEDLLYESKNYFYINNKLNHIFPIIIVFSFIPIIGPIMMTVIGIFNIQLRYYHFLYMLIGKMMYYLYIMNFLSYL